MVLGEEDGTGEEGSRTRTKQIGVPIIKEKVNEREGK